MINFRRYLDAKPRKRDEGRELRWWTTAMSYPGSLTTSSTFATCSQTVSAVTMTAPTTMSPNTKTILIRRLVKYQKNCIRLVNVRNFMRKMAPINRWVAWLYKKKIAAGDLRESEIVRVAIIKFVPWNNWTFWSCWIFYSISSCWPYTYIRVCIPTQKHIQTSIFLYLCFLARIHITTTTAITTTTTTITQFSFEIEILQLEVLFAVFQSD